MTVLLTFLLVAWAFYQASLIRALTQRVLRLEAARDDVVAQTPALPSCNDALASVSATDAISEVPKADSPAVVVPTIPSTWPEDPPRANKALAPQPVARSLSDDVTLSPMADAMAQAPEARLAPPAALDTLWALIKGNLFAVAGVGLLLLGFAFLFKSIHWGNLLSPSARIALGWAFAAALSYLGTRVSARNALWGQVAQGGGAAVAYLATYVAATSYEMLQEHAALAAFTGIAAWTVWRALHENGKILAAVGFLGAYAAPLLALNHSGPLDFNLAYGLLTTFAALLVSQRRGWIEIAVHAHLCAAGLASLAYARNSAPLPPWEQQLFLHLYLAQFFGWFVLRSRKVLKDPREIGLTAACVSVTVISYVALQQWLLGHPAFSIAMGLASGVLMTVAWKTVPRTSWVLRETTWVLAGLTLLAALVGADAVLEYRDIAIYTEGAILLLGTTQGSFGRAWLGRLLIVVGAAMTLRDGGPAALLVLGVGAYALAWWHETRHQETEFQIQGWVSALAVPMLGIRWFIPDGIIAMPLLDPSRWTGVGAVVFTVVAYIGMLTVRVIPARARLESRQAQMLLVFLALAWTLLLAWPTGEALAAQALTLAGTLATAATAFTRHATGHPAANTTRNIATYACGFGLVMLTAIVDLKADGGVRLAACHGALGASAYAALLASGWLVRRLHWPELGSAAPNAIPNLALLGALLAALALLPFERVAAPTTVIDFFVTAQFGLVFAVSWITAQRLVTPIDPGVRRVIATTGLIIACFVWVLAFGSGWWDAWNAANSSALLTLLAAAAGVALLIHQSRSGNAAAWRASAAVCVIGMLKLLSLVGSALLSPIGIAGSLLGMGALFLGAGYIAPQPPGEAAISQAASSPPG